MFPIYFHFLQLCIIVNTQEPLLHFYNNQHLLPPLPVWNRSSNPAPPPSNSPHNPLQIHYIPKLDD